MIDNKTRKKEGGKDSNIRIPYSPHPGQLLFHRSKSRFRVLACGRRWGKSLAGINEIIRATLEKNNSVNWIVAPSYPLALTDWLTLKTYLPVELIKERHEAEKYIELINDSTIWLKSADHPDSLRSQGIDMVLVDEAAMVKREAWEQALRPALGDKVGRGVFISTPKGYNWFYEMWKSGRPPNEVYQSFHFPTSNNPFFTPSEYEELRKTLPELVFRQEILAEFVEDAGIVFRGIKDCISDTLSVPKTGMRYYMGVDLGKHEDFTVCCVLDEHGNLAAFDRIREMDWVVQKSRIITLARVYNNALIVLDARGAGDPIYDELKNEGLFVRPYILTMPSKEELVSGLTVAIEQRLIKFPNIDALVEELKAFGFTKTQAGNVRYGAPQGYHDDCVIALGLAVNQFLRNRKQNSGHAGTVKGDLQGFDSSVDEYKKQFPLERLNTGGSIGRVVPSMW